MSVIVPSVPKHEVGLVLVEDEITGTDPFVRIYKPLGAELQPAELNTAIAVYPPAVRPEIVTIPDGFATSVTVCTIEPGIVV